MSYAGLDPGVRESDGHRKDPKVTQARLPLLRWVMIQLAHRMKQTSRWGSLFACISHPVGNKKATVALARRLLLVIFAILRESLRSLVRPAWFSTDGQAKGHNQKVNLSLPVPLQLDD